MSAGHCVHKWWNPFIGMSWHDAVIVPLPGPVPRVPHLSFSIVNGSWLGSYPSGPPGLPPGPGPTVGGGGAALMGRGTDAGYIVPHIPLPPLNSLLPLVILFGESKIMFGSSSVKIPCRNLLFQDSVEDLGCVALPVGIPLGFDFDCNEIVPVPLDLAIAPNTIHVGMSPMDWLAAAIDIGIELALGAIFHFGGKAVKKAGSKARKARKAARQVAEVGEETAARARRAAQELRDQTKQARKAAKPFKKTAAAREAADRVRAKWQREAVEEGRAEVAEEARQRAHRSARAAQQRASRAAAREGKDEAAQEAAGQLEYQRTFFRSLRRAEREAREELSERAGRQFDDLVGSSRWKELGWGLAGEGLKETTKEALVEPFLSSLSKLPQGEEYYVGKWGTWFDWDLKEPEVTPEFGGQPSASQDWWEGSTTAAATPSAPARPWWGGNTDPSATSTPLPYDNWWS